MPDQVDPTCQPFPEEVQTQHSMLPPSVKHSRPGLTWRYDGVNAAKTFGKLGEKEAMLTGVDARQGGLVANPLTDDVAGHALDRWQRGLQVLP